LLKFFQFFFQIHLKREKRPEIIAYKDWEENWKTKLKKVVAAAAASAAAAAAA
jgi:hypothetical protein